MLATAEGASLLRAVLAEPDSDEPRGIYADWLEEAGELGRAGFWRAAVEFRWQPVQLERPRGTRWNSGWAWMACFSPGPGNRNGGCHVSPPLWERLQGKGWSGMIPREESAYRLYDTPAEAWADLERAWLEEYGT